MTNKEALQKAYQSLSPFSNKQKWEFNNNLVHLNFLTKHIEKNKTIFDVGCGIGILAMALNFLDYKIEGGDKFVFKEEGDLAVNDINKLQDIWKKYNLKISDQDILVDRTNEQYDVIISIATIEHQTNPKKFLEKIKTAIKSDGYIYLATPNVSHLLNRIRFLFGRSSLGNLENFYQQGENFTGHWREYTLSELKQMCVLSGFKIVKASNIQSMKPNLKIKNLRLIYVSLFRLVSYFMPGARDTNIILGKK